MAVSYDQLKNLLGGSTIEDVVVRLDKLKVKYLKGKRGKPFTTEFALNHAMGLASHEEGRQYPIKSQIHEHEVEIL